MRLFKRCYSSYLKQWICDSMNVINVKNCSDYKESVDLAVKALLNGSVIGLPTDTIYGIGGLAQSEKAVEAIYKIKRRSCMKPLAICVANIEDVYIWAKVTIPNALLDSLLPGPVTLLFERSDNLNQHFNPDERLVGVRIPDNSFIRDISVNCHSPIALTSANLSTETSSLDVTEFKELWGKLEYVFDGGRLGESTLSREGSTIVDLSRENHYEIIRKGSAFTETTEILHKFGYKPVNS